MSFLSPTSSDFLLRIFKVTKMVSDIFPARNVAFLPWSRFLMCPINLIFSSFSGSLLLRATSLSFLRRSKNYLWSLINLQSNLNIFWLFPPLAANLPWDPPQPPIKIKNSEAKKSSKYLLQFDFSHVRNVLNN